MTHLVIVVYNRYDNLKHWLECWSQCDQTDTQLVVIHNTDKEDWQYQHLCEVYNVTYIQRPNVGYDIGAFQDVCRGRLQFPDWQRLLWVTDDTFPMSKTFIKEFNDQMEPGTGVVCMCVSNHVKRHIRTTGFMIDRTTAEKLTFCADPVTSKEDCYQFEHRSRRDTFLEQVERMGLKVKQVAPDAASPLWDSEYTRRLKRQREHDRLFNPERETVTFICPIYKGYPQIISSLIQQTVKNWKLWLIHDGPGEVDIPNDPRIKLIVTPERRGNWGHSYRSEYLQKVESKYVVITNSDNYHAPTYIEYLLNGFDDNTVGVYCDKMLHSYVKWNVINCKLERGYIDCAGMMLNTSLAKFVGWKNVEYHSADWLFFNDLIQHYGADKFKKIEGCLLVHN